MRFAPLRRALFRHCNFQKWSDNGVFCTFWVGNVLRATTACNFSSLIWPAGSAPAALASLLFDPPEPQIIGKTQCFATFLPFHASASSFFLLFFLLIFLFSLPLPGSAFHPSILSEVWLLNILRKYLTAFAKPAGHREVGPGEFDVHSRWKPAREAEEKRRRRRRKEDEDKAGCNKCWLVQWKRLV